MHHFHFEWLLPHEHQVEQQRHHPRVECRLGELEIEVEMKELEIELEDEDDAVMNSVLCLHSEEWGQHHIQI